MYTSMCGENCVYHELRDNHNKSSMHTKQIQIKTKHFYF